MLAVRVDPLLPATSVMPHTELASARRFAAASVTDVCCRSVICCLAVRYARAMADRAAEGFRILRARTAAYACSAACRIFSALAAASSATIGIDAISSTFLGAGWHTSAQPHLAGCANGDRPSRRLGGHL